MKKIIRLGAFALAAVMLLCSCGGTARKKETSLDPAGVVTLMLSKVSFSTEMTPNSAAVTASLYGVDNAESAASATAQGTVADMVAVFYMKDATAAEEAKTALESYLKDTVSEYKRYAPEEITKLNKAVLSVYDTAVTLCVAEDSEKAAGVLADILAGKHDSEIPKRTGNGDSAASDATSSSLSSSVSENTTATSVNPAETTDGNYPVIEVTGDFESYGGVVRSGNACYECYYYNEKYAKSYTDEINEFTKKLPDTNRVYVMLIPLSSSITLPDALRGKINSRDQNAAIEKVYAKLSEKVVPIRLYDTLMKHRTEYLYFRTDHHWTALGAYYAFSCLMKEKGQSVPAITEYQSVSFPGFLGSFYRDSKKNKELAKTPDEVIAYYPMARDQIKLLYRNTKGQEIKWPIIGDVSKYGASLKYATFAAGDNPYTKVTNASLTDGSVCILVKESFGNVLVPFLSDRYQTIYELDYRYYQDSMTALVKEHPNADVIFADNMSMLQSRYLQGKFAAFMKQ